MRRARQKPAGVARGKTRTRAPASSAAELESRALAYLNRFDCTTKKLRDYLRKNAEEGMAELIDELLERYQSSGLVSDARFAATAVRRLSQRGSSGRAIAFRLGLKGVPGEVVSEALSARALESAEPDLDAARNLVRRRKLGHFRPEEERAEYRRRDLATLARAGFDFDTARRALGSAGGDEDEF